MFDNEEEMSNFAANINTLIHGKVHLKYEELGKLNNQFVGIFYLQRNNEYSDLRQKFVSIIEQEELRDYGALPESIEEDKKHNKKITQSEIKDIKYILSSIEARPDEVFLITEAHRTRQDSEEYKLCIDNLLTAYDSEGVAGLLSEVGNIKEWLGIE